MKLTTFQATILLSLAYNSHGMGECKGHVRSLSIFPFKPCVSAGLSTQRGTGRVHMLKYVLS